jgi:alpha-galactosidase
MKITANSILLLTGILLSLNTWCQAPGKVWLSDLDLTKAGIGWGTPGKNVSCQGNPIILNGVKYEQGFGTHANSSLLVKLGRKTAAFHAVVGIDDEEKDQKGSVVFRILGDRKVLWESGTLVSGGKTETVDISTKGIDTLLLTVDGTGDGISYDHADWADACFSGSGLKPVTIAPPVEKAVILTPVSSPVPKINGPKI